METGEFATLDACVEHHRRRWTVPGIAVGIYRDGAVELRTYGVASLETGQPITPDTVFRVASISKVFTAAVAIALVGEGRLDLDRPVVEYLPDVAFADPLAGRELTLRLLLSHQSGLWGDFSPDCGLGEDALRQAVGRFATLRQITRPRELWAYCNAGFHLTGAVIERVTGQAFETAMAERIVRPLGLERTCYFWHDAVIYPLAVGYNQAEPDSDLHVPARQYYPRNRHPAGGVIITARDLLRFAACHLNGGRVDGRQVLRKDLVRAMQEPQIEAGNWADAWGIGWDIRLYGDTRVVGHGGSINGYQSHLTLVPERRFALAILTNSGRGSAAYRPIERWLLRRELGLAEPERPRLESLPSALDRLAGSYEQPLGRYSVRPEGGGLRVEVIAPHPRTGRPVPHLPLRLAPVAETTFIVEAGPTAGARVEFILDPGGRPRFMRLGGRLADYRPA